jgi:hypothetical protein
MAEQTEDEEKRDKDSGQPFLTPKFDKITPLLEHNGKVHKLEEAIATKAGELSQVYETIKKDFHGNPGAVKLCRRLANMTTDKAFDFMRTFMPLAKSLGLVPSEDLVDLMAGVPEKDFSQGSSEDRGLSAADAAPKEEKTNVVPIGKDNAIDRAREHLRTGGKPPAPKGPAGDGDLVAAGDEVAADIEAQRKIDEAAFEGGEHGALETTATAK